MPVVVSVIPTAIVPVIVPDKVTLVVLAETAAEMLESLYAPVPLALFAKPRIMLLVSVCEATPLKVKV